MSLKRVEGLPVFNAKRAIKLHITAHDIKSADPKKPNSCAVAKACLRSLHAKEVRVHLSRVYVRSNNLNWQRYFTPANLRSEIVAFDRGGVFEPGTYHLAKISKSKTTGKQQGGDNNSKRKNHNSKNKKRAYHVLTNVRGGPA